MTLGHLDEVFRFCTAEYESCPVFRGVVGGVACAQQHETGHETGHALASAREPAADPSRSIAGRFGRCDGPVADDLAANGLAAEIAHEVESIANLANACIGKVVELTVERTPLGRSAVA